MTRVDLLMNRYVHAMAGKLIEEPEDFDEEFGFYHPFWYVYDTWVEHEKHGLYPDPGGYADQDALLMADWKTLDRRYHKAAKEIRHVDDDGVMNNLQARFGQNQAKAAGSVHDL